MRSRKGYWAFTTEDVERVRNKPAAPAGPNRAQQALASIATSVQAARWVRTWVGTERGDNGKTRLTLTWEPLPIQQGLRREQAGRVSLLAATAEGGLVYRGRSPDTAAPEGTSPASRTGAAPAAAALASAPRRIAFEAPPGKLELRLTIEAAGGGTLDTETRTIDIPDLTVPKAALSTPRVFRARTARDFQAHLKDAAAVPVAAREFSRTERLLIRFDAYGAGSETPAPAAAILARDGKKIADLPVAPAAAGGTHQLDVALNTMASGEYVIEITVTDASGTTASELVPIRIGA